jgi:hypothetical protein
MLTFILLGAAVLVVAGFIVMVMGKNRKAGSSGVGNQAVSTVKGRATGGGDD